MGFRGMVTGSGVVLALVLCWFGGTSSADTACHSTYTFGSGQTFMKICISQHGNLVQFESPASEEHIRVGTIGEGYVVCSSSTTPAFDAGFTESGWGAPTITQPNGADTFPLTIVRTTTDGDFELEQKFSRDTTERDVTITMKLKNVSGATRSAVRVHRYFDGDIGASGGGDIWDKSEDSAWGREAATGENPGLMLTGLTSGTHSAFVETFAAWNPTGAGAQTGRTCSEQSPPPSTPTAEGDFVGRVGYLLGTMNANQTKTVKFLYRRF